MCGILYEQRPATSFLKRSIKCFRNLREWSFFCDAANRVVRVLFRAVARFGNVALRFLHACPAHPNGSLEFGLEQLGRFCGTLGCSLLVTADIHSPRALEFARGQQADLGIVYGTRILRPELFNLPKQGSINIHKRKLPDYRGGGPVGLWELLEGQREIGIVVHRVETSLDAGAVILATTIPIDPFDTLASLALKADVVGNDLLVRSVSDFAHERVREKTQEGAGRIFRTPKPQQLIQYQKQIALSRPTYKLMRGRPVWKLLFRTLFFGPLAFFRNWSRRLRRAFPVIILYHHLVTDRPHHLGIPTEVFLRQVEFLKKHYKVATLGEAIEMLNTGTVKAPTVVLTFDDGYQDNFINLRAVTEARGIPFSLFVCPQHLTDQREFDHDLNRGQPNFLPLTWEQITYLSKNGFEIGSHTRSHFDCGSTDMALLESEIVGSRTDLEERLGCRVRFFSFPWGKPGNMSRSALEMAEKTYSCAFSAYGGANSACHNSELWHLQRCSHPNDLWELELTIQSLLEL